MKQQIFLFLLLTYSIKISAQEIYPCGIGFIKKYVINTDNLNFREKPSVESNIIDQFHLNDTIITSENCKKIKDTINTGPGCWIKTIKNGKTGFVWSNFLIEAEYDNKIHGQYGNYFTGYFTQPPELKVIDLIINEKCLGLFKADDNVSRDDQYELREVSKDDFKEEGYLTNPIFIISNFKTKSKRIVGKSIQKMIFPGEQILFYDNKMSYTIYSLGEVIPNNEEFPIISRIKDYELRVRDHKSKIDYLIYRKQVRSWPAGGYSDRIIVKWIGDLNHDNKLDLVVELSFHHEAGGYTLLLSNTKQGKTYYSELDMGEWIGG